MYDLQSFSDKEDGKDAEKDKTENNGPQTAEERAEEETQKVILQKIFKRVHFTNYSGHNIRLSYYFFKNAPSRLGFFRVKRGPWVIILMRPGRPPEAQTLWN